MVEKTAVKYDMRSCRHGCPGDVMNGMLVYMADNQAKGSDAAVEFLKKHETYGVNGYLHLLRKKSKLDFKI